MSTQATAATPISDAKIFASENDTSPETNRLKGFLGTASEMTSVAETLAPHSVAWVKSLSDDELFPRGERALQDIADDILVLDEIRQRFRLKGSMRGYSGWKEFVEKNSRYSMRTIQNRLAEINGKDVSKANHNPGNMYTRQIDTRSAETVEDSGDDSAKEQPAKEIHKHKNPAVDQLSSLRKRFNDTRVQIERVGSDDMSSFQVWVNDVPATNAAKGRQRVTVQMSAAQLRTVKGTVNIGANGLTATEVEQFLTTLGVKQ